jgi:hypothetical protein
LQLLKSLHIEMSSNANLTIDNRGIVGQNLAASISDVLARNTMGGLSADTVTVNTALSAPLVSADTVTVNTALTAPLVSADSLLSDDVTAVNLTVVTSLSSSGLNLGVGLHADLPDPSTSLGYLRLVSDAESTGDKTRLLYSDGSNWLRVSDNALALT